MAGSKARHLDILWELRSLYDIELKKLSEAHKAIQNTRSSTRENLAKPELKWKLVDI